MLSNLKSFLGWQVPHFYVGLFLFFRFISFFYSVKKLESKLTLIVLNRDWILERICIEIQKESKNAELYYSLKNIPRSQSYFFSHYKLFMSAVIRNPHILLGESFIFFTHNSEFYIPQKDLGKILNFAKGIFVMNKADKNLLRGLGIDEDKIEIVYAGANTNEFKILKRNNLQTKKTVGLCLRYESYPEYTDRKNHHLIIDLVKSIESHNVILLGKNWRNYKRFKEIEQLEYFLYVETDYKNYTQYYNMMDIFLSMSKLEGGPVPLIEAMLCGVFPVVTATGFAPDLITHKVNGLLVSPDASKEEFLEAIYSANPSSREGIRKSVENLSWSNFARKILSEIGEHYLISR